MMPYHRARPSLQLTYQATPQPNAAALLSALAEDLYV